jgi:pantoate--beta-alanine ligase
MVDPLVEARGITSLAPAQTRLRPIIQPPTVREPDGLALSSRNSYLSPVDRERARCLSQGLLAAQAAYGEGERDSQRLIGIARAAMTEVNQLQYLELRDAGILDAVQSLVEKPAALCVAAYVGTTRLIDNVLLIPPPKALADRELELVSHVIGRQETVRAGGPQPS